MISATYKRVANEGDALRALPLLDSLSAFYPGFNAWFRKVATQAGQIDTPMIVA